MKTLKRYADTILDFLVLAPVWAFILTHPPVTFLAALLGLWITMGCTWYSGWLCAKEAYRPSTDGSRMPEDCLTRKRNPLDFLDLNESPFRDRN